MEGGKRILVVEDSAEEKKHAAEALMTAGLQGNIVGTYRDFLNELGGRQYSAVLSDLYFPSGFLAESPIEARLSQRALEILDCYTEGQRESNPNPIGEALRHLRSTGRFGENEEEVFENIAAMERKEYGERSVCANPELRQRVQEAIRREKETDTYTGLRKGIEDGTHLLPLGVFAYATARVQGVPCVIVTDAYHHGPEFQPFVGEVGAYFDQRVDGHKQWAEALDKALRPRI